MFLLSNCKCRVCQRSPRPEESNSGPRMWHRHWFVCGHIVEWTCPDCYPKYNTGEANYAACPTCGNEEEFT
jgi:hypothetical protein